MNQELPDVQAGFRRGRGARDQIVNICWVIEKAKEFQKNLYFCFIDYAKACDCVKWVKVEVVQSCPTLWDPMDYSPWNSPGQNTGVVSLSLLLWIFPTQESNWGLLLCRQILYQLSYPVWITTNWKIIKEMGILEHLTCLLRNLYAGQEAELELDMDDLAGSKSGKVYIKAVYCHPASLNLYLGWKVKVSPSVVSQSLQSQGL